MVRGPERPTFRQIAIARHAADSAQTDNRVSIFNACGRLLLPPGPTPGR